LEPKQTTSAEASDWGWKGFYKLGGITVLIAILIPPAEIVIGLLPGAERAAAGTVTVVDWFMLLHNHWFLGLRNLGLLNIVGAYLFIPTFLAVYTALRRDNGAYAALGTILFLVGITVYLASNRAFTMLSLSRQYINAATDAQRSLFVAAGQAILAEGQSRAGVLLTEFASLLISAVMLRGKVFSRATACAGMLGNALLMVIEIAFMPISSEVGMVVAAGGGLSLMTWYFLMGRRLLQLGTISLET
jgi:hypothetical protein